MGPLIFFLLLCILVIILMNIVVVRVNSQVVLTTFARRFSRVLSEGIYFTRPWEIVAEYRWSHVNQEYKTQKTVMTRLPTTGQQVDMAPFECETRDGEPVSVDVMIVYKVADAKTATYATEDPLLLLTQQVNKHVRRVIVTMDKASVTKSEADVAKRVLDIINTEWAPTFGLALEACEIQGISRDEDTIRRRRQLRDGIGKYDQATIEQAYAYSARQGGKGPNVILNTRN